MSSLLSPYNVFSIFVSSLCLCLSPFPYPCNLVSVCRPSVCVPPPPFAYVFFPCISSLECTSSVRGSARPGLRQDVYLKPELSFKVGGVQACGDVMIGQHGNQCMKLYPHIYGAKAIPISFLFFIIT